MRRLHQFRIATSAALLLAASPAAFAKDDPKSWDGLVEVKSSHLDAAYLMPGADFRNYSKVMLDEPEAAFRKDWRRDMNDTMDIDRRVSEADAQKILSTVQTGTGDIFTEAFTKGGFQVVKAPGADVLRVRVGVVDLYVNAPDVLAPGRSASFTTNAGEATLVVELRDSLTNALLARVLDRRETQRMPQRANSVTNAQDFRMLMKDWANVTVKGVTALKGHSPIPATLEAGQKLQ